MGKSSLSKSIARALDRKFVRISLGGVKDEAEIRGHRRTYIGSYPGQIVKGLKKAGSMNPVFLLDEIDKLNSDFRGDPASALLEALDPEQNCEFVDHYLDLELDLSQVFFITTANFSEHIPPALLDRMEVIELPGYTEREKLQIAKNFLLKKQAEKNGFSADEIHIADDVLLKRHQRIHPRGRGAQPGTRDRGHHAQDGPQPSSSPGKKVRGPGSPDHRPRAAAEIPGHPQVQQPEDLRSATRSASPSAWPGRRPAATSWWSKRACCKGKGELILTGRLGEVMKESSSAAFSYTKLKLFELELDTEELKNYDIHLHIPEGAVPKEGPSAGVTLAVSLISLLTGIPVRSDYAMTGEITLRGKILPVGGIKEKIIAAHRYGIRNILIPVGKRKGFPRGYPRRAEERHHASTRSTPWMSCWISSWRTPSRSRTSRARSSGPLQEANLQ